MRYLSLLSLTILFVAPMTSIAQDDDLDFDLDEEEGPAKITNFYDTRVINAHSVEVLDAKTLDFRITHRFGDIATPASPRTLFGLDNSSDIRIAFEYGITDNLTVGAGRSKGSGPYSQYWDGVAKYKILQQTDDMPVSLSVCGSAFFTSMKEDPTPTSITSFTKTAHRFAYYTQLIVSKRFGDLASLQLAPGYMHRNYVLSEDDNGFLSIGAVGKIKVYKKISFVAEYNYNLRKETLLQGTQYRNPLGFGVEIKTYAHVFQLSFMNSRGIGEGQFIPFTSSDWGEGQFRFGFTISRHF